MKLQLNIYYEVIEVITKRETEKAELLTITYMHSTYNDRCMTMDVWSPKSAIVRTGSQITGFAPWMIRKLETELHIRN